MTPAIRVPASSRGMVALIVDEFEKGLVDDKDDAGGLTKWGITLAVFLEERPSATATDLEALSREEGVELLTERYAYKPGFDRIADRALRLEVIDYGIHSGQGTATRALQRAAGVHVDGILGPDTIGAVNHADASELRRRVLAQRLELWASLFQRKPAQRKFAAGWILRAAALLKAAR